MLGPAATEPKAREPLARQPMLKERTLTAKALSLLPYLKVHRDHYKFLQKSQWWSKARLEEYQLGELGKLLGHAYENVPYYRRVFDQRGLKPRDVQDFADLRKLPYLTKAVIRQNFPDMVARNYPAGRLEHITTGGTTGEPLELYYERGVSRAIEWAFVKVLWDRIDYRFSDKCIILKGGGATKDRFWSPSLFGRWLFLSSFRMTDENMPRYIEKIRKYKPRYIQGFPSSITILARYMKARQIEPFESLRAVICASENVYPWQRRLFEDVFRRRVFSFYGLSERVAMAGECERGDRYHEYPEYGVTELIRPDDGPARVGEPGLIVATGLTNFAMPLIRYKTDDVTSRIPGSCPCGREYPLWGEVEGRWANEFIVARDGRLIPAAGIHTHTGIFDHVDQYQLYQDTAGELVLKIVKKDTFVERDFESMRAEVQGKLGPDVRLEIRAVDDLPRTRRGKFNFLVQKLPLAFDEGP